MTAEPNTPAITLAAPLPGEISRTRGFPAAALDGLPVFCLADLTVRAWVRGYHDQGTPVFIGDPGWVPDADLAPRTLTFPADQRDLAIISHGRAVWQMTHSRDAAGQWHELPRLGWEPMSPGWKAYGDRNGYLISRGPDDQVRLTRWDVHATDQAGGLTEAFVREVLDNSIRVQSPAQGQAIAQAYEDGRDIEACPGWRLPRSTKPPYYPNRADLETVLHWQADGA